MTEPRGSARDSSRQDRKAPENCLLRTGQPRLGNVVRNRQRRQPSPAEVRRISPADGRQLAERTPLLPIVGLSFLVMLSTRSAAAPSAAAIEACAALVRSRRRDAGILQSGEFLLQPLDAKSRLRKARRRR